MASGGAAAQGGGPAVKRRAGASVRVARCRPAAVVVERDVRPPGPYRLPPLGRDGIVRRDSGGLVRLLHVDGDPAVARAWPLSGWVRLRVEAVSRAVALRAAERMRFALGLDHDVRPFARRFARDPLIGPVLRRRPWLRPWRTPEPFQALAWAVCEQLIESERAAAIERRLTWRYGRAAEGAELRDAPSAAALAARAPAELEACGLTATRARALRRVAQATARGHLDLLAADHERAWRRLRTVPGVGSWTCEKLAFHGQGRDDQLPAADLAYLKLVGHLAGLGRRAREEEVRAFFAPYGEHAGLAGLYALAGHAHLWGVPPAATARSPARTGRPGARPARTTARPVPPRKGVRAATPPAARGGSRW